MWANWDADGNDRQNVSGEWVKVRNYDPVNPLPLDGWYVRESSLRRFTFPAGAVIPPNSSITVYAGQGENFGSEFFWNLTKPVFDNTTRDDRGKGDGAYLFDPQGDLRAWMIYPCKINCADPAQGHIEIDTQPRREEYISIRNTGPRRSTSSPTRSRPRPTATRSRRARRSDPARRCASTPRATPRTTPRSRSTGA